MPGRDVSDYDQEPAATPLLALRPCGGLLLLGEPGMGKTNAIEHLTEYWAGNQLIAPHPVYADLESVLTDASFESRVAQAGAPGWRRNRNLHYRNRRCRCSAYWTTSIAAVFDQRL